MNNHEKVKKMREDLSKEVRAKMETHHYTFVERAKAIFFAFVGGVSEDKTGCGESAQGSSADFDVSVDTLILIQKRLICFIFQKSLIETQNRYFEAQAANIAECKKQEETMHRELQQKRAKVYEEGKIYS